MAVSDQVPIGGRKDECERSLPRVLWLRCHAKSDLSAEPLLALDSSEKWSRIATRPDEESQSGGLADFKKVFPPHLIRKRKQIGRQGSHRWRA